MRNNYFRFKQFTVFHDQCAMKVGTDGVLLGATAEGGSNILDIGTGTGLIALMMAQRFPQATVTGIDIDEGAVTQAWINVKASPFTDRITIKHCDIAKIDCTNKYDCITCNPPFFENATLCPNKQRTIARHSTTLPYSTLMQKAAELLTEDGCMSLIIPTDIIGRIEEEITYAFLFITKRINICTVERKAPKRIILQLRKKRVNTIETTTETLIQQGKRSEWYENISKEFYLTELR